jgi:hypothetical protein
MTAQPVSVSRGCNTGVAAHNAICVHRKFAQTGLETFQMPRETRSARPGSARVGDAAPSVRAVPKGVFRKEGEYWTVGYGGKAFRLKDSKGLGYLAHLLRHPAAEFHVLDLVGGIAGQREDDETAQTV